MPTPRSKPIIPPRQQPRGADGKPRPTTLKDWGVPRGHDTQWQLSAYERDLLQRLVPAQLHIFNKAEIWKLCPLKGCRRARQCTGTPRANGGDGAEILNRPPCMRPPHIYGDTGWHGRSGKPRKMSANTRRQFMACWDAFHAVLQVLRPHIEAARD